MSTWWVRYMNDIKYVCNGQHHSYLWNFLSTLNPDMSLHCIAIANWLTSTAYLHDHWWFFLIWPHKLMFSYLILSYALSSSSPSCLMSSCFFHIDKHQQYLSMSQHQLFRFKFWSFAFVYYFMLIPNALGLKIEQCCEAASLSAHLVGVSLHSAAKG